MRKVIGIGETILDIIFRNNRPHTAVPGGSTFNGLISLGRLGVPVSFISEVGNDHVGDIIRDFMKENNLSTRYVDRFPGWQKPDFARVPGQRQQCRLHFLQGLSEATP